MVGCDGIWHEQVLHGGVGKCIIGDIQKKSGVEYERSCQVSAALAPALMDAKTHFGRGSFNASHGCDR
jgi:hypothetical protein